MSARVAHRMAAGIADLTDLCRPSYRPMETRAAFSKSATAAAPHPLSSSPDRSGMVAPGGKTRRASPAEVGIGSVRLASSGLKLKKRSMGSRRRGGGLSDPQRPRSAGRHPAVGSVGPGRWGRGWSAPTGQAGRSRAAWSIFLIIF